MYLDISVKNELYLSWFTLIYLAFPYMQQTHFHLKCLRTLIIFPQAFKNFYEVLVFLKG